MDKWLDAKGPGIMVPGPWVVYKGPMWALRSWREDEKPGHVGPGPKALGLKTRGPGSHESWALGSKTKGPMGHWP